MKQQQHTTITCDICSKEIKQDPITIKESQTAYGFLSESDQPTKTVNTKTFCSKKCSYIHLIYEHMNYLPNINAVISHLIEMHQCKIEDLEEALNQLNKKK